MLEKKITIIVPTRERADTLFYCLKTLVDQKYDNLEIIVSDNCSTDNTSDVVNSLKDPRIKYIKTDARTDMSNNWEFAASHVEEGYVGFLGDDDGYMPGALNIANAILTDTGQSAISWKSGVYNWPGTENENTLELPLGRDFFVASSKPLLKKFGKNNFDIRNLLSLYPNGLVQANKLKELRSRFGGLFNKTTIPDVFSTVVLTSEINSFAYSNAPLSLIGISKKSNSGSSYESSSVINKYRAEYLEYTFHPRLELFQYMPLAVAEGYFRALDVMNTPITDNQAKTYLKPVLDGLIMFLPSLSKAMRLQGFVAAEKIAVKNGINPNFIFEAQRKLDAEIRLEPDYFGKKTISPAPSVSKFGVRWEELRLDTAKFDVGNIFDACKVSGNLLSLTDSTKLNFFKSRHAPAALSLARLGRRFAEKFFQK